jgi:sarcosine oxidase subunit alpha
VRVDNSRRLDFDEPPFTQISTVPSARRLNPIEKPTTFDFEGRSISAHPDESVAVALFAEGEGILSRSVKYHRPRSFFCLSGNCGACLLRIDGQPNQKACRTQVREGQRVERQNAFPSGSFDIFGATDVLFSRGMDPHTLLTGSRPLNALMKQVVRQFAGFGRLPDPRSESAPLPTTEVRRVDVVVIGGGPAGLACATTLARSGQKVLLVHQERHLGGSLLTDPDFGPETARSIAEDAQRAGVESATQSVALAYYPEDRISDGAPPGLLAVATPSGLWKLSARRYVYATGTYDRNAVFGNNDRPGIFAARAVGRLLVSHHVLVGQRPIVIGDGPYARALTDALSSAGAAANRIDGARCRPITAYGRDWVRGLEVEEDGVRKRLPTDAIAVAALPAPATELPREHGVTVEFRPEAGGFACRVDDVGRSPDSKGVFVCGDAAGFLGPLRAQEAGRRTGEAVAKDLQGEQP